MVSNRENQYAEWLSERRGIPVDEALAHARRRPTLSAALTKSSGADTKHAQYCSFCGKSQHEVRKLIAGPTVFICDECVELCMDIVAGDDQRRHIASAMAMATGIAKSAAT